jgi:hypothetical protein
MTQFINHINACNVLDSSRCMRYHHQQQRSSPHDAIKTSNPLNTKYSNLTTGYKYPKPLNRNYSNLTTGYKYPNHWIQSIQISPLDVNILRLNMTMMHGYKSKDSTMQNHLIYIQQPQCKRPPPFTLINSSNNCIIKYLRPHSQQVTIQIRIIITLSST